MIKVIVKTGSGDKEAPFVSEPLLTTEALAIIRARQELYDYSRIVKTRVLRIPHDPNIDIDQDVTFSVSNLVIFGEHKVEQNTIDISPKAVYNTITVSQYQELP